MNLIKKFLLVCLLSGIYFTASAQIEVTRLMTKITVPDGFGHLVTQNFTAIGLGAFLNFSFPVSETGAVSVEGGFQYFSKDDDHVYIGPVLAGYRQLLVSNQDYGWYLEPMAGYTFGSTDIPLSNELGGALYGSDGNQLTQKVAGPNAGMAFGYLFQPSGRIRFDIGLRYEHTFVSGDHALNILALRISHSFSFGRRND